MDWIQESKRLFRAKKPEHFTDYRHCRECAEHDETLRKSSVKSIGMDQLGNPGWDPMCFCSVQGKLYYMPALVRLCLETLGSDDPYLCQFIFHLAWDGENNDLLIGCTTEQRRFICDFIAYLVDNHPIELDYNGCADDSLRVYAIWQQE